MKRLRAIAEFDDLGSGFALAMRDLEIRGAGNLLGPEQHGFVAAVGFDMYCRLLDEAVRELKGLPAEEGVEPRITTNAAAFIPDECVQDAEEKIALYKRLADARELEEVDKLAAEMTDRFGRLPPEAKALIDFRKLRVLGRLAGAGRIQIRGERVDVDMIAPPSPEKLKEWMSRLTVPVEFAAGSQFGIKVKRAADPIAVAVRLVSELAGVGPASVPAAASSSGRLSEKAGSDRLG
jgi:transcription-repair coupling factor (superfamily II helicase)